MLTEDNLMRMIRIATAALARILGLKAALLYTDAMFVIDQALQQMTGLNLDLLTQLDEESLISMLSGPEGPEYDQLVVTGDLFYESGDIQKSIGQFYYANQLNCRALMLYLEAALTLQPGDPRAPFIEMKISPLVKSLAVDTIPTNILYTLFCYQEKIGGYQDAEHTLLALQAANPSSPEMAEEVREFYQRLLRLDDQVLKNNQFDRGLVKVKAR